MRRTWDDRGSSPIQYAIAFPVVLVITFILIQGVLWAYARNLAYTAARSGVAAGRLYEASPADGSARARQALDDLGGNMLTNTSVSTAGSSQDTMRVHVSGQALTMLPGFHLSVAATVTGPIEHWTTGGPR
ncbi:MULTISPECIES: TadE family protein [unclassified Streptomyces]|uniref:TadE family protein n=1 Tax=unclassified Streptomyces TaxID=2593676 RepID=UPI000DBA113B|nr:TadE family protein [Streptomyces sp. PsTaAH-137]MYT68331.1 pilus assembly protein [Streptomyces sp. SID8367]RAJ76967.1 TadE-like protein [Streptomyces sp. PsTaAH-137]